MNRGRNHHWNVWLRREITLDIFYNQWWRWSVVRRELMSKLRRLIFNWSSIRVVSHLSHCMISIESLHPINMLTSLDYLNFRALPWSVPHWRSTDRWKSSCYQSNTLIGSDSVLMWGDAVMMNVVIWKRNSNRKTSHVWNVEIVVMLIRTKEKMKREAEQW